jgi:hypothetical protein
VSEKNNKIIVSGRIPSSDIRYFANKPSETKPKRESINMKSKMYRVAEIGEK